MTEEGGSIALSEEQYKSCVSAFEAFSREGYLGKLEFYRGRDIYVRRFLLGEVFG